MKKLLTNENIVSSLKYRWSKVSTALHLHCVNDFQSPALGIKLGNLSSTAVILSNHPQTFRMCFRGLFSFFSSSSSPMH